MSIQIPQHEPHRPPSPSPSALQPRMPHRGKPILLSLCFALSCAQPEPVPQTAQLVPGSPLVPEVSSGIAPTDPNLQWNATWVQKTASDFVGWRRRGVIVRATEAGTAEVQMATSATPLDCPGDDIDGGTASFDGRTGLCSGQEPMTTGLPAGVSYYTGAPFYFSTLTSPEVRVPGTMDHLVPSWHATTPAGTWIQLHIRAKLPTGWSGWYRLPIWSSDPTTIKRHSVKLPTDATGGVDVDTFLLKSPQTATAYQLSVTLFSSSPSVSPTLHMVAAVASRDQKTYPQSPPDQTVWGQNLPVPGRSQGLPEYKGQGYGGGGEVWCSPTSTSMVLEYWSQVLSKPSLNVSVPVAAAGCYDWVYDGTGNWPFNTAFASTLGMFGIITRLYSMSEAEQWIKAGVPLIISISFKAGELPGAPITKTNGHLIVVRGFDAKGDVIVNDPAGRDNGSVQFTYPRAALEAAWTHSHRTTYIIHPPDWGKTRSLPAL
jgi:hypothetical protein